MVYNSFSPSYYDLNMADVKIEFDEGVYFEVIDPKTGEVSYLLISSLIGQETSKTPGVGDYVLKESKILPEPEIKEEKKSLWDEEFKIDLDWEEEVVDKFIEVGEIYPISGEEVKEALNLIQEKVFADSGIVWNGKW